MERPWEGHGTGFEPVLEGLKGLTSVVSSSRGFCVAGQVTKLSEETSACRLGLETQAR